MRITSRPGRRHKALEIALISLLFPLVITLAVLQCSWQEKASASNREQMVQTIAGGAKQLSGELNNQLALVQMVFPLDPSDLETGRWGRFAAQWSFWQANAPLPELVREIYLVPAASARSAGAPAASDAAAGAAAAGARGAPQKWDPASRSFVRVSGASTPELAAIHALLPEIGAITDEKWFSSVGAFLTVPAVILPVKGTRPESPGIAAYVCAILDREVLEKTLIPAVVKGAFGGAGSELNVKVADVADGRMVYPPDEKISLSEIARADLVMPILSPGSKTMFFVSKLPSLGAEPAAIARSLDFGSMLSTRTVVRRFDAGPPKDAVVQDPAQIPLSGWVLSVTHKAGSVDRAIAQVTRRNLAVGFGILIILAGSVVLLYVSYGRARDLSLRQSEFVAGVSHELRTPLAVICSAGENLSDGLVKDGEKVRGYGKLVATEGRRLRDMVEKVLTISGRRNGSAGAAGETADVREVVSAVVEEMRPVCADKGITLEVQVDPLLPPVAGSAELVRSAVRNLVVNAALHAASGKWIGVDAMRGAGETVIKVADHGEGIPRRELPRIFEPFFRGHRAAAGQVPGSGLGLAVVKRSVELLGGQVSVSSAPGKGSVFAIRLPVSA